MLRLTTSARNVFVCTLLAACGFAQAATVSGIVYRDIDDDGTRDLPLEVTVANARVHAVDNIGNVLDVVSDAVGAYTVTLPGNNIRLEFLPPLGADFFEDSLAGGTAVRFTAGNQVNVDVGFAYPGEFCQLNPNVTYGTYANGNPLPAGTSGDLNWFMQGPFQFDSTNAVVSSTPTSLLNGRVIGSTYGLAFSRATRSVFASAFVKRHAGLGTGGLGGVYRVDLTATDGPDADPYLDNGASLFMDLDAAPFAFNFGTLDRSAAQQPPLSAASSPNRDIDAFDKVGRIGIGEMTLSDDERTLWLVNLNTNELYEIPLTYADIDPDGAGPLLPDGDLDPVPPASAAAIRVHPMVQACTDGVFRAFAVEFHQDRVYVGGVCNGESNAAGVDGTNDLQARVFEHVPGGALGSFLNILSFDLAYPRGFSSTDGALTPSARWLPWIDQWTDIGQPPYNAAPFRIPAPGAGPFGQAMYPQPILATLQFDADGALFIGMMDRFGHQVGNENFSTILADGATYEGVSSGDTLLACPNGVGGALVLENNATCGVRGPSAGVAQAPPQGPGSGEFFWDDKYRQFLADNVTNTGINSGTHQEINLGGNALNAVTGEFVSSAFDPRIAFRAQGYVIQNARDGTRPRSFQVFGQDVPNSGGQIAGFGKAAGLGNVELQCTVAPLQIGNRFWLDTDNDGVQDAAEAPIAGVALSLFDDAGTLIARALTNATGNYLFNIVQSATADPDVNDAIAILREPYRRNYRIVVDAANFGAGQPLFGRSATVPDADASANGDARDSDVVPVTGGLGVVVAVGDPGEVDHTIDGGFVDVDFGDLPDTGAGVGPNNYETQIANNGPRHPILTGLFLGTTVDAELDGQQNLAATGDDTAGAPDDEDGLNVADLNQTTGTPGIFRFVGSNPTGAAVNLCGFVDWNGDGDFADASETASTTLPNGAAQNATLSFGTVPATGSGNRHARFRLNNGGACAALTANTLGAQGEVEDYLFNLIALDFGDLPDTAAGVGPGNYETLLANNGPRHNIIATLRLGGAPDAEGDGQPNAAASGDGADEDGINLADLAAFTRGASQVVRATASNTTGATATVCGLADLNGDGDFADAGEAAQGALPNGFSNFLVNLNFGPVPATAPAGSYARFRVSTTVGCAANGLLADGEVEDYPIAIGSVADLAVVKTGPASATAGGALIYTVLVTNNGPSAANGAILTDPVVANYTVTGVSCGAPTGGAVCPAAPTVAQLQGTGIVIPTLPSGGTLTFTITGTAGVGASVTNTASIAPPVGTTDPVPGNDSDPETTPVASSADLAVVKTGPASANAGGPLNYTVLVTNNGPSAANGAILTDPVVANYTVTGVSCGAPTGGAVCPAAPTVAQLQGGGIVIPTLPSGGTLTFTITGTAGVGASVTNTASIAPPVGTNDPIPGNNSDPETTPISSSADLAVVKTGPASATAGGALNYTVLVTNNGPSAANGAILTDPVVANYTVTGVSCGAPTGGAVCPAAPTVAQLQGGGIVIPTLPSGGTLTFTITGTAGNGASVTNIANIAPPGGTTDPIPGNNTDPETTTVGASADLAVLKTGPASATAGGALIYTVLVTNNGPSAANGAILTDPIVANYTVTGVSCGAPTGGAVCPAAPTVAQLQGGGIVIPTLPSGGTLTFTITGTAGVGASVTNTASIAPPGGTTDPIPGNNSDPETTPVGASADLAVLKTGPASASAGGPLIYTVLVTNNGPSAANGAILTDPVVANYTVTGVSCGAPTGGAVCPAAPTVGQLQGGGIVIPTLPSGGTLTFTITGTAGNGASVTNIATITPPPGTTDPVPPNNTDPETTPIIALDFGDLPDPAAGNGVANYNTLLADNGPRHPIVAGLRMGAAVDSETDGQPNVAANGDGADEDGANTGDLAGFVRGAPATVRVTATNQSQRGDALLCGYADWNGDGDFGDASETASPIGIADGNPTATLTVVFGTVPATAVAGSYARFRISTFPSCPGLGAAAPDGEVEDYPIAIAARDFGDLPDTAAGSGPGNYETLLANGGAFHRIVPSIRIGSMIDSEVDGQPNAAADGDGGDEEGVSTADLMFTGGQPANVRVTVTNTSGAAVNLCGFVDFNADGDFLDGSETATTSVANGTNGLTATLAFGTVPLTAAMSSYARFRLGTAACALGANGDGGDGEVEDYAVTGMSRDFGDLPDAGAGTGPGNYETLLANGGAFHRVVPELRLGATEDVEPDGQPNAAANGDGNDEDGVNPADLALTGGAPRDVRVTATNTSGASANLCGYLDFNADGDFSDVGEIATALVPTGSNGSVFTLAFGAPPATPAAASYGRFRLGTAVCVPNGDGGTGEVEDYPLTGVPQPVDFGDLPDAGPGVGVGNYETLLASGGPRHPIVPGLRLGATVDGEADGQPNATATGDGADEDGVNTADLAYTIGAPVNVRITVTNSSISSGARVCGFIDFNGDGDFADAQEAAQVAVPPGSNNVPLTLAFGNAPSGMTTMSYARFRLSTDAAACAPNGIATNGEVEDYATTATTNVLSLGNLVWEDANNSGTVDPGEPGIAGVSVSLFRDSNNDGTPDGAAIATQLTDAAGLYLFAALTPDTYIVEVTMPAASISSSGTGLVYAVPGPSEPAPDPDNDVNNDDNGTRFALIARSLPVTLGAGQEPVNDGDASANSNLSVDFGFLFNFDLALQKRLGAGQPGPFRPGDIVTFDIQIYNQGAIAASNIVITDYIPVGLELVDGTWAAGPNRTATRTIAGPLAPGTSIVVTIRLRIDQAVTGTLVNVAEISSATDAAGNPRRDIDSTPDNDPANEGPPRDDELGNMDSDQDDSDPAPITLGGGPPAAIPMLDTSMLALLATLFALLGGALLRRRA